MVAVMGRRQPQCRVAVMGRQLMCGTVKTLWGTVKVMWGGGGS